MARHSHWEFPSTRSDEVTMSITGHVTKRMLAHYSHVDAGEKRQAAARVLQLVQGAAAGEAGDQAGDQRPESHGGDAKEEAKSS